MIELSIVIVNLNTGKNLDNCLQNIFKQRNNKIELIVIDGLSKDNSIEVIKKYSKYIDYWHSKKDNGIYDAMNEGIKKANGKWVYFLGTDDQLCENILNEIDFGSYEQYEIIYGDVLRKPSNLVYDGEFTLKKLFYKNICHQAIFYKRSILKHFGYYKTNYKVRADYAFNIKVFSKAINTCYIPKIIAEFNDNGFSSNNFDFNFWQDYRENYIRPFKGVISRKERYGILWKYYYNELSERKSYFKCIYLLFLISINELNLSKSIQGMRFLASYLLKRNK